MKYKDIARQMIMSRGAQVEPEAGDGKKYNPSGRDFTDKQLAKISEQYNASREWLIKKWKLDD